MSNWERVVLGMKLVLAISGAAIGYAVVASVYNAWAGEDAQLEVVSGAIGVAVAGSFSILFLWIYTLDRRDRN